jgi:hypothetical protein
MNASKVTSLDITRQPVARGSDIISRVGRASTQRKPPIAVWDQPTSRHDHRTRPVSSPAELPNDAPDSPRHESCIHHYIRRESVQRITLHQQAHHDKMGQVKVNQFRRLAGASVSCTARNKPYVRHDSGEFLFRMPGLVFLVFTA